MSDVKYPLSQLVLQPGGTRVRLVVHETAYSRSGIWLDPDAAADLAASLVTVSALAGGETSRVREAMTRLRDAIREIVEAIDIVQPAEAQENACPFCQKIIAHPANRHRHLAKCMQEHLDTEPEDAS